MFAYWKRADDAEVGRPDWLAIGLFFAVACVWSWTAGRWGGVRLPGGPDAPLIDGGVLVGFGPVMGALVADLLRPMKRVGRVGFLGRSRLWSLVALAVPPLCLAAWGLSVYRFDPHVDGLTMGFSILIYCLGEELGWREWLHNALGGLALWRGALITWALWFAWYWTFSWRSLIAPGSALMFGGLLLVASFALAAAARRTRSSAIATGWHAAAKALGPWQIAMVLLLSVATWAAGAEALRLTRRKSA